MTKKENIETAEKIVEEARLVMRRGKGEISMELEPKEMGKMEMKITMEQSKLVAKIRVETQEAKNLFTDGINKLKESLNESGIQVDKIDVFVKDNGQNKYDFLENQANKQAGYRHKNDGRQNKYYDEENNPSFVSKRMGYNTIELVA